MVVVDEEEVVEISADLLCRSHGRVDVKFLPVRESRKSAGKLSRLNILSHIQLSADTFFFCGREPELTDIIAQLHVHLLKRIGKLLDFVAGMDVG